MVVGMKTVMIEMNTSWIDTKPHVLYVCVLDRNIIFGDLEMT
jgi:hypothetical protein